MNLFPFFPNISKILDSYSALTKTSHENIITAVQWIELQYPGSPGRQANHYTISHLVDYCCSLADTLTGVWRTVLLPILQHVCDPICCYFSIVVWLVRGNIFMVGMRIWLSEELLSSCQFCNLFVILSAAPSAYFETWDVSWMTSWTSHFFLTYFTIITGISHPSEQFNKKFFT